jgi:hypothetical protein
MGGAALSIMCGPLALACIPFFTATGAMWGSAAGAITSTGGNLSTEQATQLRDRMLRLNQSHDKLAELATNINDRAGRYWDLNSTEPQTTVRVEVQNLILASTHDNQVRAILQVSVTVKKKSDKPLRQEEVSVVKDYEYASPYASLDLWLDDENDFADASISITIRQISNQIVSDLAGSSNTDGTVQIAKIQPQSISNSASSAFEFYGEAEDEINNDTYNKNVWDKALVETEGDQTKTKARYIELRANQLYSKKVGSVSDTSLYQQAAPITPGTQIDLSGTYLSPLEYYGQAEEEINTDTYDKNLWAKALVETGGDEAKRRARYIELRVKQLYIAQIDLVGTYTSVITYKQDVDRSRMPSHFGKRPNIVIDIQQKDEVITGVMSGDRSGEIEGLIEGNKITFNYYMKVPGNSYKEGHGTWVIGDDGSTLNGTWRGDAPYNSYAGKWNLTKVE